MTSQHIWIIFSCLGTTSALRMTSMTQNSHEAGLKNLVIVRTANPRPGRLQRIHRNAVDMKENMQSTHYLVSSHDTDESSKTVFDLPEPNLHRYNSKALPEKFPAAAALFGKPEKYMHVEGYLMALEYAQKHVPITEETKVWVLEDDMFTCGNLSTFIKKYEADESDFLTMEYNTNWAQPYPLLHCGTHQFAKRYGVWQRVIRNEFIQRYSVKFLNRLRSLTQENVTAVSEMFGPTVCMNDRKNCRYSVFSKKHIGEFKTSSQTHDTDVEKGQKDEEKICSKWLVNGRDVTVNHAAKYYSTPEIINGSINLARTTSNLQCA